MKVSTLQRRASEINDILESMDLEAKLYVSGNEINSLYMLMKNISKGRMEYIDDLNTPLRDIIYLAKGLEEPKLVKLDNICMSLVGETVWVDKEVEIVVTSIGADVNGTFVKSESGRTYNTNNLWIEGK